MGTRNLTLVRLGGQYKIAQYGQSDGHLDSLGVALTSVLRQYPREQIVKAVEGCTFATTDDIDTRWESAAGNGDRFCTKWPWLSRNCAGDDLLRLLLGERIKQRFGRPSWVGPVDVIYDQRAFAKDSLSCQYCYLIDFDRNVFEIYISGGHGAGGTVPPEFEDTKNEDGYRPVKLAGAWSLDSLPSLYEMERACGIADEDAQEGTA